MVRVLTDDDRHAFGKLVHRHQSAVRRFLRHLTHGDEALADDLAQETFIQAYRSLNRFLWHAQFTPWLLGIAYNFHRNTRRRHPEQVPVQTLDYEADLEPSSARSSDLHRDLT